MKRLAIYTAVLITWMSPCRGEESASWQAPQSAVERSTRRHPGFNFDEQAIPPYELPDLMGAAKSKEGWRKRRREILRLFQANVYGSSPARPEHMRFRVLEENLRAMGGAATHKRVAIEITRAGRTRSFELTVLLPNAASKPVPLFLFLNNRSARNTDPSGDGQSGFWPAQNVIARGYGVAALQVSQLAPDDKDHWREGVIALYDDSKTKQGGGYTWGALAAWAWGASRAMDYFQTDPRVNATHVAVIGHSRGGKAALWAGAEDERFAVVISNESGEGGAALNRRWFGETVEQINRSFPHWFAPSFKGFNRSVDSLPTDQHMLLALVAPRALYIASADEDLWSDPHGEFLSLAYSSPAFALWNDPPIGAEDMPPLGVPLVRGRRGYHIRAGGHDLIPYDWARFMDFTDKLWRK